jgi:hypothetical protein
VIAGRASAYALLGLAALLTVVAVSSVCNGTSRLLAGEDARVRVEAAARGFVEAYGTFEAESAAHYHARLHRHTTGELHAALTSARLDPAAVAERRSIHTDIESVTVNALSRETAAVDVTALQTRRWIDRSSGEPVLESVRQRVAFALVEEDGRWLVREMRLVAEQAAGR